MKYNPDERLRLRLRAAIQDFIDYRDAHGGILLPNAIIVEDIYDDVMKDVGLRHRPPEPKKIHIFGQDNQ